MIQTVARRNKTEGKMTLFVDAARAAFNSSYATLSVKRDIARFCTSFCDWEPLVDGLLRPTGSQFSMTNKTQFAIIKS